MRKIAIATSFMLFASAAHATCGTKDGPGYRGPDGLDILVVQIDGIHIAANLVLVAAIGIDSKGAKHPLGLIEVEGATENARVVHALIDNLVERGPEPTVARPFIVEDSKALSKAIRRTFGRPTAIQRCQGHKARNIVERLPKGLHAADRRVLRRAWKLDESEKTEKLIRNHARRLEPDAPGRSASILEGSQSLSAYRLNCDGHSPAPTSPRT